VTSDELVFDFLPQSTATDSAILTGTNERRLRVVETGLKTVIGFESGLETDHSISSYRDEIHDLIEQHNTEELVIDLSRIDFVPSGMLGLIASLRRDNSRLRVAVLNANEATRETFKITRLDQLVELRDS
jgi:anti-anti-sigma factor